MVEVSLLVAIILSLSEILKRYKYIPKRFIPLFNIVVGIGAGVVFLDGDLKTNILHGLIVGLTASGAFDLTKVLKK
jgi:hypothetical protein